MLNKKGFTLIEVLAVIVILGLLAGILTPTVKKMITNSEESVSEQQIKTVITAAKKYMVEKSDLLPEEQDNSTTIISIEELINEGIIDNTDAIDKIKDNCVIVSYSSVYNQYNYTYSSNCE